MMKHHFPLNVALAAVLIVPAVTLQEREGESLSQSLARTISALESLAGIERAVNSQAPDVVQLVREWTEPPLAPALEQERILAGLRTDLQRLQDELDQAPASEASTAQRIPRTGLDDVARRKLARPSFPEPNAPRVSFEAPGYAADPLCLARVLYKQAQWEEALALLQPLERDAHALYWKARSLEKLGRGEQALEAYREVEASSDSTAEGRAIARRAREQAEFLAWRLGFERPAPSTSASPPGAAR